MIPVMSDYQLYMNRKGEPVNRDVVFYFSSIHSSDPHMSYYFKSHIVMFHNGIERGRRNAPELLKDLIATSSLSPFGSRFTT